MSDLLLKVQSRKIIYSNFTVFEDSSYFEEETQVPIALAPEFVFNMKEDSRELATSLEVILFPDTESVDAPYQVQVKAFLVFTYGDEEVDGQKASDTYSEDMLKEAYDYVRDHVALVSESMGMDPIKLPLINAKRTVEFFKNRDQ